MLLIIILSLTTLTFIGLWLCELRKRKSLRLHADKLTDRLTRSRKDYVALKRRFTTLTVPKPAGIKGNPLEAFDPKKIQEFIVSDGKNLKITIVK